MRTIGKHTAVQCAQLSNHEELSPTLALTLTLTLTQIGE